jgi:hypothetical protein
MAVANALVILAAGWSHRVRLAPCAHGHPQMNDLAEVHLFELSY